MMSSTKIARVFSAMVIGISLASLAHAQQPEAVRKISEWNLSGKSKLAISGYDPVAYFPEGGGKPVKGSDKFVKEHGGVTYRFASKAHLDLFVANPSKYEPSHGGWCSWAMREGEKVEVDPKSFIVKDGRLFLFYDGILADTRAKWLKGDHTREAAEADANWKKLSGEDPHQSAVLKAKLDARRAEFEKVVPAELKARLAEGQKALAESGIADRAMKVGQVAPDFTLPDADGSMVSLATLLKDGPVVVTWYRGGWCPYCNIQLREYQNALPQIQAAGAKLVAISPQRPDVAAKGRDTDSLKFAVLSDQGGAVAKSYGIAFEPPSDYPVDLSKFNADGSRMLPLPATYVIDRDGKIVYAFVETDYTKRAEPSDIVAALRALKGS